MSKILLTGGAGFIGTQLARRLVDEHDVLILDNLHRDALTGSGLLEHRHLTFVHGDVLDAPLVTELAAGSAVIVHMAAIAGVDAVLESPVRTMRVNLQGTLNVFAAALQTEDTIERVVDFSTSEVFGPIAYRVQETDSTSQGPLTEARWAYAISKLAGEQVAQAYFEEYELPSVAMRLFNVYGPGQVGDGAIHSFIEDALAGRPLVVHNGGGQIRAWCYIDDLLDAVELMISEPAAIGQVFNVGNERSAVTIHDLATRVVRAAESESEIVFEPLGHVDVELRVPNVDKARALLGWEAKVELDEGLARTIDWYRKEGGVCPRPRHDHDLSKSTA